MTGVGNMTGTLQLIVTRKFAAVCQVELGLHELTICRYGRPHAADYRAPPAPSPLDGNVLETIESLKAQLSQLQEATMHQPYPSRERERDYMPDPYGPPPPGYAPRGYGREASPPYRSGPPPRRLSPAPMDRGYPERDYGYDRMDGPLARKRRPSIDLDDPRDYRGPGRGRGRV